VTATLDTLLAERLGCPVVSRGVLTGGCIAEVWRLELADGRRLVAKHGGGSLDAEGWMLRFLAERSSLPVPRVVIAEPSLLVMELVPGSSRFDAGAEVHAAELLADLHSRSEAGFGLERDTVIGPLRQPNPRTGSWVEFWRDWRLLHMAAEAHGAGRLSGPTLDRVRSLAARLDSLLEEPAAPSLLHGDVWTTNVLAERGRVTAFLDPAIYYGHAEAELAFIALFNTFGGPFFGRYHELRPIRAGFEQRRAIYTLYPLLVHARLFGGGYENQVGAGLRSLGF
jgi:fructosamine-3-kinase